MKWVVSLYTESLHSVCSQVVRGCQSNLRASSARATIQKAQKKRRTTAVITALVSIETKFSFQTNVYCILPYKCLFVSTTRRSARPPPASAPPLPQLREKLRYFPQICNTICCRNESRDSQTCSLIRPLRAPQSKATSAAGSASASRHSSGSLVSQKVCHESPRRFDCPIARLHSQTALCLGARRTLLLRLP